MNPIVRLTCLILLVNSIQTCLSGSPLQSLNSDPQNFATLKGLTDQKMKYRPGSNFLPLFPDSLFRTCFIQPGSVYCSEIDVDIESKAFDLAVYVFNNWLFSSALLSISFLSLIQLSMLALGVASGFFAIGGIVLALLSLNKIRKSNQKTKGRLIAFSVLIVGILLLILGIASTMALIEALS